MTKLKPSFGLVTQVTVVSVLLVVLSMVKSTHLVVQSIHGHVTSEKIQHSKTSLITPKQTKLHYPMVKHIMLHKTQCLPLMVLQCSAMVLIRTINNIVHQDGTPLVVVKKQKLSLVVSMVLNQPLMFLTKKAFMSTIVITKQNMPIWQKLIKQPPMNGTTVIKAFSIHSVMA